jgi:hypothetical protein
MSKARKPGSRTGRDELRAEYQFDFRKSRPNRFAARVGKDAVAVVLEPDAAQVFDSAESVNRLLRSVIEAVPARGVRGVRRKAGWHAAADERRACVWRSRNTWERRSRLRGRTSDQSKETRQLMTHSVVVEWAPFAVKPGVDDATLIAASEALQNDCLSQQRGFIQRELLKGQNGQWVDLSVWESKDAAGQAVTNAGENPVCFQYCQLMANADHDDPGAGVFHFERVRVYERQGDLEADSKT